MYVFVHFYMCMLDKEPDQIRMRQLVADRIHNYHGLGTVLGLSPEQLKNIEAENSQVVRRCTEVLDSWVHQESRVPVTWQTLITALREINEIKIAKKIAREIPLD